jgi:hypothetical protein
LEKGKDKTRKGGQKQKKNVGKYVFGEGGEAGKIKATLLLGEKCHFSEGENTKYITFRRKTLNYIVELCLL